MLDQRAAELSGGQKKLLEIGRALMAEPKLLLLDEPVAGVNPTLAREIGEHLRALVAEGIPVLLIEHHMDTIAALCDPVIVMAEGRHLRQGIVRRTRRRPRRAGGLHGPTPMSLLRSRGIVAGYGHGDEILKGVHLTVEAGEIVAVIGPNGAGKSTLLKTIAGLLHPAQGRITLRGATDPPIAAARGEPPRHRLRAAGAEHLRHDVGAREPGDGRLARSRRDAPAHR